MKRVAASSARRVGLVLFGLAFVCACAPNSKSDDGAASTQATSATPQPGGMASNAEWPSYNGGFDATRFSTLARINTGNVASLTEVARFKLPETTAFQSGPVLIDGMIT